MPSPPPPSPLDVEELWLRVHHRGPSAACISDFILSVTAQSYFLFSNHWFLCCFHFLPLLFPPQTVCAALISLTVLFHTCSLSANYHTHSELTCQAPRAFPDPVHLTLSLTVLQSLPFCLLPLVFKQRFGFWTWSPPPSSSLARTPLTTRFGLHCVGFFGVEPNKYFSKATQAEHFEGGLD